MTITLTIELVLAALLVATLVTFIILFKKGKVNGKITTLVCVLSSLALALAMVFVYFSDQPSFTINGEKEMVIPVFAEYNEEGATATFRDEDLTERITLTGGVDTEKIGKYNVEYEFTHRGKVYRAKRKISVVDTESPEITLKGEAEVTVSSIDFYSEPGFTATDNYDGDLTEKIATDKVQLEKNKYKITYGVADSSGNKATVERIIIVKDIIKPSLKSNKGEYINVAVGETFTAPTVTATDDLDGDLTAFIKMEGSVNTATTGVYQLVYTVLDKAGNKGSLTVKVNVYVPDDPSLSRIYLTFDDGPSSNVTPRVLDILKKNNVKATFFINGYSADKLPLIKRIIDEGHTLAIHGMSHDYASIYSSVDKCVNNFNSLRDKVKNDTGYTCTIMRFPGGSSNEVSKKYSKGVVTKSAAQLTAQGWRYFDWNVSSGDANGKMGSGYILNCVKTGLKKGRANVVLMHDNSAKSTTADALQEMINFGNNNGYVFCRIDENTPDVRHKIAN